MSITMSITVLRHGETERPGRYHGRSDVALSPQGFLQMETAVAGADWDHILSSPLRRCAGFAEALARRLHRPMSTDARLCELDFGEWEGRTAAELQASAPDALGRFWSDPERHPPPGGEVTSSLRRRVLAVLSEHTAAGGDHRLLIVTHAGPIRVLLAERDGIALNQLLSIELALAARIEL